MYVSRCKSSIAIYISLKVIICHFHILWNRNLPGLFKKEEFSPPKKVRYNLIEKLIYINYIITESDLIFSRVIK